MRPAVFEVGGGGDDLMAVYMPLGMSDFRKLRTEGFYYVDKTGYIGEIIRNKFEVMMITRPRRFGKTLFMSMLEDFFDIRRDSRMDFRGLAISSQTEVCSEWMNQWPVLFITLKSVAGNHFESAYGMLTVLMADICKKYAYLEDSALVNNEDREVFRSLMRRTADAADVKNSLYTLMRMMNAHFGKPVIFLIDEYDVPLAKASEAGYYDDMIEIISAMLGKALKTNEFLKFAVVTGCLKIAKESIFTGTNNMVSDTITGERFNEFIGFTQKDVQKLLAATRLLEHAEKMRIWYDGYRFGSVDVYCPWDVLNHVAALQANGAAPPQSYWENTSHNGIIRRFIERKDLWVEAGINDDFEKLLAGGYIVKTITENLTYDMVHSSAENLWSLLYLTGYLTQVPGAKENDFAARQLALRIPNEEIRYLFRSTIIAWFEAEVKTSDRGVLFEALWGQKEQVCSDLITKMLFNTISYYDYKEDFYHAFMVGLLSFAGYKVESNREQGEGCPDILLRDDQKDRVIVIEIKRAGGMKGMESACQAALKQIREREYAKGLEDEYDEILGYGMSFYKKKCLVRTERYS